jgi:hypothetical protein
VLLSSCGGTSRFSVNRLLARRIDTALKTKTLRSGKWLKLSRQINNGVPASCKRWNRHSARFFYLNNTPIISNGQQLIDSVVPL